MVDSSVLEGFSQQGCAVRLIANQLSAWNARNMNFTSEGWNSTSMILYEWENWVMFGTHPLMPYHPYTHAYVSIFIIILY